MMPLGAPSISKYGSLVRLDAQIVALRAHCARTARTVLEAPLMAKHSKQAHAHMTASPSNSSMSPSMPSTRWEQQGWEELGGTSRVGRS